MAVNKQEKKFGWRKILKIFGWLFLLQLAYIILGLLFNPPITITQTVNVFKGYGLKRDYISYDKMGTNIKLAVMAGEDQLFPDHNGFDMKSIEKAMAYNKKHPNKVRGASTISQQTAKNVFLWQGGGFFRKGLEVYFTFMIEKIWGKRRILERYLNVAEMGPGIFGVQAAAKKYFNKNASDLSRQEAAMIAACLPNPKRFTVKPLSRYVQIRSSIILRYMNNIESDVDIVKLLK
ncbi:MAG: monofunctional biosynthetic peptidoglycan transglycosylase [Ferruginibacter sp.]